MVPFYLVCDFESFLSPVDTDDVDVEEEEDTRGMRIIDEHKVSGFCCYRVTNHEAYQIPPFVYSGPDVMDVFYTHVMKESETVSGIVRNDVDMMPLTPEEERQFQESTVCDNCAKAITDRNRKVRHHCHISGQYQFAACNDCNLQLKPRRRGRRKQNKAGDKRSFQSTVDWAKEHYETNFFLPIVFHNLKSYDAHFVIKYFKRKYTQVSVTQCYDDISIIPLNSQKYLQFQIGELHFLDSFQFFVDFAGRVSFPSSKKW